MNWPVFGSTACGRAAKCRDINRARSTRAITAAAPEYAHNLDCTDLRILFTSANLKFVSTVWKITTSIVPCQPISVFRRTEKNTDDATAVSYYARRPAYFRIRFQVNSFQTGCADIVYAPQRPTVRGIAVRRRRGNTTETERRSCFGLIVSCLLRRNFGKFHTAIAAPGVFVVTFHQRHFIAIRHHVEAVFSHSQVNEEFAHRKAAQFAQ